MAERGELCRILYMEGKTMEKVYDRCCGIDVHKKLIAACLLCGRKSEVREFGATTDELLKLSDWLVSAGCGMDCGFASAWSAQGQLHTIQRSAGIARVGAVS